MNNLELSKNYQNFLSNCKLCKVLIMRSWMVRKIVSTMNCHLRYLKTGAGCALVVLFIIEDRPRPTQLFVILISARLTTRIRNLTQQKPLFSLIKHLHGPENWLTKEISCTLPYAHISTICVSLTENSPKFR